MLGKILLISILVGLVSMKATPIAVFHGFGDECNFPGMWDFTDTLSSQTGAYAACIEIGGDGIGEGSFSSVFMNMKAQGESACKTVLADPNFQDEFSVIGLSQGGLIARYIVEECPTKKPVRNFITLGGPHRGVAASP